MTKVNMFLVGDGHTNIIEKDSLLGLEENMYDYVVANPPYGPYEGPADINTFEFTNLKRYELMFLEKMIKATKYGGEMAIVTPDGTLETPTNENFRIKLLQHCNISAIISLTRFAFAPYTKEKTYVLFMQKKQKDEIGQKQDYPIWHFIVDYDGYANSDKRYKTKYHDDLGELEEKFDEAVNLARLYISDHTRFGKKRSKYEREVNQREKEEGLTGMKYGYVEMDSINNENYHNLLSEYHLRPYEEKKISEKEFEEKSKEILDELKNILNLFEGK